MDFSNITYSDKLGITAARINRDTGELFLNSEIWDKLPVPLQKFIKLHEYGHYKWQTTSEKQANEYAYLNYIDTGDFNNDLIRLSEIYNLVSDPDPKLIQAIEKYYEDHPELKSDENESDEIITGIIAGAVAVGTTIYGAIHSKNLKRKAKKAQEEAEIRDMSVFVESYEYAKRLKDEEQEQSEDYTYIFGIGAVLLIAVVLIIIYLKKFKK